MQNDKQEPIPAEIIYADDIDFIGKKDADVNSIEKTLKTHCLKVNVDKTEHTSVRKDSEDWKTTKKATDQRNLTGHLIPQAPGLRCPAYYLPIRQLFAGSNCSMFYPLSPVIIDWSLTSRFRHPTTQRYRRPAGPPCMTSPGYLALRMISEFRRQPGAGDIDPNLFPATLTAMFCCGALGLLAMTFSMRSLSASESNRPRAAKFYAEKAMFFATAALALGAFIYVVTFITLILLYYCYYYW
ncbi:hypothetical protein PoB_000613500 [Plakobranchus ocellatus]|uniref:Dolichyl-diphosphooligosaccharide-protein glycosyltransferase subunit OST5 n=1 Tax=Plakobranchus ocellatus TaxID=259542 RepID=A0AAV3YAT7_9GAST|nr:hypothetical protein PoB_000613500 [Plakobranchus ocellatus]